MLTESTHRGRELLWRWSLILVAVAFGFWRTWRNVWEGTLAGTAICYIYLLPIACVFLVIGISFRRGMELPINDRQIDVIVGLIGMLLALGIQYQLVPRFTVYYELMHVDIAAAWIFVMSSAVLLFGLRPTLRYWPVWLLIMLINPLSFRFLAVALGGGDFGYGLIPLLLVTTTIAWGVGRTRRQRLFAFVAGTVMGLAILTPVVRGYPNAHAFVLMLAPASAAAAVILSVMSLWQHRLPHNKFMPRPRYSVVTNNVWRVVPVVLVTAVAVAFIAVPNALGAKPPSGPQTATTSGIAVPAGWAQIGTSSYSWPERFFGGGATLTRQSLRADRPNAEWDTQQRRREVQADVLTVALAASLDVNPVQTTYDLRGARLSDTIDVDIGHDITAHVFTIVDDKLLLTWTNLSFVWQRGQRFQRISLVSVDNHDASAMFPEPQPSMPSLGSNMVALLFRGGSALTDERPEFKDLGMLQTLAREIVTAQPW